MISDSGTGRDHPAVAARRVARNTFYLVVADVGNKAMMFVFFVIAARHLGASEFGVLSFALAYVTMFAVFTDLGLGPLTARELARNRSAAKHLVSISLAIKLTVSLLLLMTIALSVNILVYSAGQVRLVYVCSLFVVTNAVATYYGAVFQGIERMGYTAVGRLVQTAILIVGAATLARGQGTAVGYAWLYVGASATSALLDWFFSLRFVRPGLNLRVREWWPMLTAALPFGAAVAFAMLYYWNASALLSRFCGDTAVGVYSAPFRLVLGLGFASFALSGALYPVMSRLYRGDPGQLSRVVQMALKYMLVISIPLGVIGTTMAGPVVHLLYGTGYEASVPVLRVLVWWGACMCLNTVLSNYLYSVNRSGLVVIQTALALVVNVVLNLTLIPGHGPLGAAVALVAAETLSLGMLLWMQSRTPARVRFLPLAAVLLRFLPLALAAAAAGLVVGKYSSVAALGVSVAVYTGLALLVSLVMDGDFNALRLLIGGRVDR